VLIAYKVRLRVSVVRENKFWRCWSPVGSVHRDIKCIALQRRFIADQLAAAAAACWTGLDSAEQSLQLSSWDEHEHRQLTAVKCHRPPGTEMSYVTLTKIVVL